MKEVLHTATRSIKNRSWQRWCNTCGLWELISATLLLLQVLQDIHTHVHCPSISCDNYNTSPDTQWPSQFLQYFTDKYWLGAFVSW